MAMKKKYRSYSYYPSQRKKKIKINKVRFTLFILSCLLILSGIGFGLKLILTDKVDVSLALTDDLNPKEGESLYRLSLSWEPLKKDAYKEIQININDKSYVLDNTATRFDVDLSAPNTDYKITFQARRKGLFFSKKVKDVIRTFADNERIEQSIADLKIKDHVLLFSHALKKTKEMKFDSEEIRYEIIDVINQSVIEGDVTITSEDREEVNLQVEIPIEKLVQAPVLALRMRMEINNHILSIPVQVNKGSQVFKGLDGYELLPQSDNLILVNKELPHLNYKNHQFYAESLHLNIGTTDILTYQLVDASRNIIVDEAYLEGGNKAIELSDLKEGNYVVKLNDLPLYTDEVLSEQWYCILRNGVANHVTLKSENGLLYLIVRSVKEVPEDVYDILIDPGHGGLDGGTVAGELTEANEALKLSKYIASRLEDHGLKVKLTRIEDVDPAGPGKSDYGKSPFYDEGRVEQVYRYQTKYMISNHLNSFNESLEGFEVYSSVINDDDWSSRVSTALKEAGQDPRDSVKSEFRSSEGSYKKYFVCRGSSYEEKYGCLNDSLDYLYIIRETGGALSQSSELVEHNNSYDSIPHYGSETLLIEYAYLDNPKDYKEWIADWKSWGEAVVKATVEYLGVKYQK